MTKKLQRLFKYKYLLKELVSRDLKVRYRHSVLGLLWTILNPLMMMLVLTIVFSNFFKMNIDNFPVYVLIGNIVFGLNSESSNQGMNSIVVNGSLIKKVYIPKFLFPLSNVISGLVNFSFSFIALLIVLIATKSKIHPTIITIWIPLIYVFMFTFGLSMLLCTINVYFRDMQHLYSVIITVWMYLTPIFYSIDILPNSIKNIIKFNPLYHYVTYFRKIIMYGVFPTINENILCLCMSVLMLLLGSYVFKKSQGKFILYI